MWGRGPLSSYFSHSAEVISKGLAQNGNEGPLVSDVIGMSRQGGYPSVTFSRPGRYGLCCKVHHGCQEPLASGLTQP